MLREYELRGLPWVILHVKKKEDLIDRDDMNLMRIEYS